MRVYYMALVDLSLPSDKPILPRFPFETSRLRGADPYPTFWACVLDAKGDLCSCILSEKDKEETLLHFSFEYELEGKRFDSEESLAPRPAEPFQIITWRYGGGVIHDLGSFFERQHIMNGMVERRRTFGHGRPVYATDACILSPSFGGLLLAEDHTGRREFTELYERLTGIRAEQPVPWFESNPDDAFRAYWQGLMRVVY